MGGYQLPKIQSPEDPVEQDTRIASLKSLLAQQKMQPGQLELQKQAIQSGQMQNQQQKMDMDSQKAIMRGYTEANGDPDKAEGLAAQYGAKPADLIKLRQAGVEQKMKALEYVKAKGAQALQEADLVSGMQDTVSAAPPEQKAQVYQQQLQGLSNAGVDVSKLPPQYPGDQGFQIIGAAVRGHKQLVEDAFKQSEKAKNEAQAKNANADAEKTTQETEQMKQFGGMSAGAADAKYRYVQQKKTLGQPVSPEDDAFAKAYEKQKTLVPTANFNLQMAAGGKISDPAVDQAAERYFQTGQLPPSGGRGPAAMAQNKAIMNRAAELHPGESITEASANYKANADSLKKLQTNFDQVTAFENTAGKNLDVFLTTAKKVVDSGSPLANKPIRAISDSMAGSENQAAFNAARTTALTEIAKVLNSSNASGVLSDSARHEVEGLIGPDATLKQIYAAANILKKDMANRHDSYQEQINDIKGRMKTTKSSPSGGGNEVHYKIVNGQLVQQ